MTVASTVSPFARVGQRLLDQGYSILPVRPGTKVPGAFENKAWRNMLDWTALCERRPTSFNMLIWNQWPEAGVCVAFGPASGWLVGIDFDYGEGAIREALEAIIPPSPVKKRGAKGYTGFYRGGLNIRARVFRIGGQSVCEVLGPGRQSILPPTLHPEGMPYQWITLDTLEDTPVSDLPQLPDDILERIEEALKPFGYQARPEPLGEPETAPRPADFDAEGSIWHEVNRAALGNLDAWVPALHLEKCRKTGANHYEAVAHWRPSSGGRALPERKPNLKIDGRGIRDFGDDRGYSPLDLTVAAFGCSFDEAFQWLRDLVLPRSTPILLKPRVEATPVEEMPAHDPETGEILEGEILPPEQDIEPIEPAPLGPTIEDLTHVPGLLGDMVEWIIGTARKPSRTLALGVSIAALGALMGRRFASPTNLRTNVYVVTTAPSAFGKNHPMEMTGALFDAAGLLPYLGGERIRSDSGLRRAVEQKGSLLYMIDEFGGELAKWLGKTKTGHHLTSIRDMLLVFFLKSGGIYYGDEYREGQTPPVYNPNLCLYGTSTPTDFWSAIQGSNVIDGFLPRFLLFAVSGKRPEAVEPALPPEPPGWLIERLQAVVAPPGRKGNLSGIVQTPGTARVQPHKVGWGGGAAEFWRQMMREQDTEVDAATAVSGPVIGRRNEHAQKLALIRAIGVDPSAPVITLDDLEWGLAIASASVAAILTDAADMIADNQHQADYKRILRMIGEAGPRGLTRRELLKALKGCIEKRRVEDILSLLKDGGEVDEAPLKPLRGPPRMALVRRVA